MDAPQIHFPPMATSVYFHFYDIVREKRKIVGTENRSVVSEHQDRGKGLTPKGQHKDIVTVADLICLTVLVVDTILHAFPKTHRTIQHKEGILLYVNVKTCQIMKIKM